MSHCLMLYLESGLNQDYVIRTVRAHYSAFEVSGLFGRVSYGPFYLQEEKEEIVQTDS